MLCHTLMSYIGVHTEYHTSVCLASCSSSLFVPPLSAVRVVDVLFLLLPLFPSLPLSSTAPLPFKLQHTRYIEVFFNQIYTHVISTLLPQYWMCANKHTAIDGSVSMSTLAPNRMYPLKHSYDLFMAYTSEATY